MTVQGTETGANGYAGDVTTSQAWEMLKDSQNSLLVDVRTNAEWSFVGLPDLSSLNKQVQPISWVLFPAMSPNPQFLQDLMAAHPDKDAPVLFLCRSGVRSIAAAIAATNAGYSKCYNILDGFEGHPDESRHRGTSSGWKFDNLAWVQG